MATAEIKVKSSLDSSGFTAGINSMRQAAASLKGTFAAAFSAGAIANLVKSSMDYAAQFQDMADQFGLSANKISGFTAALQSVGGDAGTASSILAKLKDKAADAGMSLEDYAEQVVSAYAATGDFSKIVDEVGAKNAPKFAAAIREMGGSLKDLKGPVNDVTAAMSDFFQDKAQAGMDKFKATVAKASVDLATYVQANYRAMKAAVSGDSPIAAFKSVYKEQNDAIREQIRLRKEAAAIEAKAKDMGDAMSGDGLGTLRSMMQSMFGSASSIAGMNAGLEQISKLKAGKQSDTIEQSPDMPARRYDELRRIGGGLMPGGQDPVRVQEQTRDEIKAVRKGIDELVRNTRGSKGSVF